MGKKRLVEYDHATRTQVWHEYDHHTGVTTIHEQQDVEHYLETNKARYNLDTGGAGRLNDTSRRQIKEGMWHVACIPIGVQYAWLQRYGVDVWDKNHKPAVMRLLNDPEWRYLRVNPGQV